MRFCVCSRQKLERDHRVGAIGIAGPDGLLVVLAHTGTGHLVHESPPLGQPPANHLARQVLPQLGRLHRRTGMQHDDRQRTFLPTLVRHADHRGLQHRGMPDQVVLQFHRGNPFPAGLDDVLGTVGQRDVAIPVDDADIARAQPSAVELLAVVIQVVRPGDPRPTPFQFPNGHTIVGHGSARVVDDPYLHATYGPTLAHPHLPVPLIGYAGQRFGHRGQR